MITKDGKKIAFITDTSCDLENNQYDDIFVIPLQVSISSCDGIKSFRDRQELSIEDLKKYFTKQYDIKTSQASIKDMFQMVEKLNDKYDEVYVFPIHRKLSGNYNSWNAMCDDYPKMKVFFLDDVGSGMSWSILDIYAKVKEGLLSSSNIQNYIETQFWPNKFGMLTTLDMKQLAKGGRVSNTKALLAKLLRIRPLIMFDQNGLVFYDKINSNKDFFTKVRKYSAKKWPNKIPTHAFIYTISDKTNEIEKFVASFKETFPNLSYKTTTLPGVIVAHTGPDYFAIYFQYI